MLSSLPHFWALPVDTAVDLLMPEMQAGGCVLLELVPSEATGREERHLFGNERSSGGGEAGTAREH